MSASPASLCIDYLSEKGNYFDQVEGAEFVLREGFVCFRDRRYPTSDRKLLRIDSSITSYLKDKGIL